MFDLSLDDGVARLRLARPEARNAIPADGWASLESCIAQAESKGARLLVVSGEDGAFCAGADLSDFPGFLDDPEAVAEFRRAMRRALDRLRRLPLVTVALIEGPCFGAGVALAMACDLRVAGRGASFAITPAKFGISYPQEDVARLVALVGTGQASRLLLGAGTIDAAEAARIRLIDLGPPADPHAVLKALSASVRANSAESVRVLKRGLALAESGIATDEEQDRLFDRLFGSDDLRERLAALRAQR